MFHTPSAVAERYPNTALSKALMPTSTLFTRAVLAGVFISLATVGSLTLTGLFADPLMARLVSALLFPGGLAMILIAGGELFTSNCMMVLGVFERRVSVPRMLRCWGIVYLGNFAGALLMAVLVIASRATDGPFLAIAIAAAEAKGTLAFGDVFLRGILCNVLICTAVWMTYTIDSPAGKIAVLYFPVALFVLCGMEHCVVNMFYFTAALIAGSSSWLTWPIFLFGNLLPATLGNILGGAGLFSGLLWLAHFRDKR